MRSRRNGGRSRRDSERRQKTVKEVLDQVSEAKEELANIKNQIQTAAVEYQKQHTIVAQETAKVQAARDEWAGLQDKPAEARSIIARADEKRRILEQL
jgi:uncharacterized coiled-coil DUF342 family protein